jgi:hypothetical protein
MEGGDTMHNNLTHALAGLCNDPDCELHNIDVAMEEEVVTATDVAFWLSGAAFMARHLKDDEEFNRLRDELMYLTTKTFPPRSVETDLLEDR